VHTVLVTHAHPCSPFALLWRQWVRPEQPLTVVGPEPHRQRPAPRADGSGPARIGVRPRAAGGTFGDALDHGTRHLDLATFPAELARLRAVGAIAADTDVVAVHLGHHDRPARSSHTRLAVSGARIVHDGTTVRTGGGRSAVRREA
jgi:adenosylcobinamide kinase/adenosylcobinamide-phosphate guanylyltransferase